MSDVFLDVADAMSPEERAMFLDKVVRGNPSLVGAKVADVLDMLVDHDAYLDVVELMYEAHRGDTDRPSLISVAVCAMAGTYGKVNTTWERVHSLITKTRPPNI